MASERRQYSLEFKAEAIRLMEAGGRSRAQVARELGIRTDILRAWQSQAEGLRRFDGGDESVEGSPESGEDELQRLRRENRILRQERDFLKKAAAYFAKESK
jgi:transposase